MSAGTDAGLSRRTVLALASSGAVSLVAACRSAGSGSEDHAIRAWFREHHHVELADEALAPIRDYLHRPLAVADPTMQPPLLFDPEVDPDR